MTLNLAVDQVHAMLFVGRKNSDNFVKVSSATRYERKCANCFKGRQPFAPKPQLCIDLNVVKSFQTVMSIEVDC